MFSILRKQQDNRRNYKYRTSPLFLCNQFKGKGKLQIPVILKFKFIQTISMICFSLDLPIGSYLIIKSGYVVSENNGFIIALYKPKWVAHKNELLLLAL